MLKCVEKRFDTNEKKSFFMQHVVNLNSLSQELGEAKSVARFKKGLDKLVDAPHPELAVLHKCCLGGLTVLCSQSDCIQEKPNIPVL